MDVRWAVDELHLFTGLARVEPGSGSLNGYTFVGEPDALLARAAVIERILDRVVPRWRTEVDGSTRNRWAQHREAALRAIAMLQRETELREKLGDDAPTLDAGSFHPWVWEGARSLWASGHYADAVGAAARKVNAETQNKVARRDISETDLFTQCFSDNDPAAGQRRLRLPGDDGGKTARSRRRGIRAFAEGCYAALRNPAAHDVADELPEHQALEQLAAFSVLARWVDTATVVTA